MPNWTRNFNPLLDQDSSRWPTQGGIYEPMLDLQHADRRDRALAGRQPGSSATTTRAITFTLREGVTWSDGEPFTSSDVKFTFDYMIENEGLSGTEGIRGVLPSIASVEAPDEKTVVITFKQVFTPALYDVGEQMIVPEHIWKDVEDPVTFLNENPVGTGPFTEIGAFQPQYYEILKNPNYWQEGKPYIDGFRAPLYPNNDSANLALVSGEIDMASNFVPDIENTYVAKDPEHFHYWFPAVGSTVHLYTNTTKAPFDDAERAQGASAWRSTATRSSRSPCTTTPTPPTAPVSATPTTPGATPDAVAAGTLGARWTSPRRTRCSTPPVWP